MLRASDLIDGDAAQCVFLHEGDGIFNRLVQWGLDVHTVQDACFVDAGEAAGLDPGVGKMGKAIGSEEQDPADRWRDVGDTVGEPTRTYAPRCSPSRAR